VRRLASASLLCTIALLGLAPGTARAETLSVGVARAGTETASSATERLMAELQNEGYEPTWLAEDEAAPCGRAEHVATRLPAAFVHLEHEPGAKLDVAVICYVRRQRAFEQTSVSAAAGDDRRLALAVVEALNGLKAEPRASSAPPRDGPSGAPRGAQPSRASRGANTAFVGAALAMDARGRLPLAGAGVALSSALSEHLSLQLETFTSVQDGDRGGFERELSMGAAWARFGPRLSWRAAALELGVSLEAGPALVWASARSKSPERIGTNARAGSAIVSSGLWLECPIASMLFLRAGAHASRLLPSIDLVLGDGSLLPFGEILLDVSLGIGLSWGAGD
jgi:hypothetical protein